MKSPPTALVASLALAPAGNKVVQIVAGPIAEGYMIKLLQKP